MGKSLLLLILFCAIACAQQLNNPQQIPDSKIISGGVATELKTEADTGSVYWQQTNGPAGIYEGNNEKTLLIYYAIYQLVSLS